MGRKTVLSFFQGIVPAEDEMKKCALILVCLVSILSMILVSCATSAKSEETAPAAAGEKTETPKNISSVYIASPFFNDEEYDNVVYVENVLNQLGITFFSPMRHTVDGEAGSLDWAYKIFEMDRNEIVKADAVVAIYYGSEGDTGTAWECGYATAIGKPVVLVHVDRENGSNLMLNCGSTTNIYIEELINFDFSTFPVYEYDGIML